MVLFYHIFLQFLHIVEIGPFYKYLQLLICILVDFKMGLSVNNKQKVSQGMAKISRGATPPPPLDKIC